MFARIISILLLVVMAGIASAQADIVVVINKANSAAIDNKTVQRIFLGKEKKLSDGNAVNPINQASDAQARGTFDESVLGRSSSQVSAYWSKLVFTGKGVPPAEVDGNEAVIAAVAADVNAIGYVDASAVTDDVKVVSLD